MRDLSIWQAKTVASFGLQRAGASAAEAIDVKETNASAVHSSVSAQDALNRENVILMGRITING